MEPQGQPENEMTKKESKIDEVKFGSLGLFSGLAIVIALFFVLNYFNILSLSLAFPKIFGFLPRITNGTQQTVTTSSPSSKTTNHPVASGNPFKEPLKVEGTNLTYSVTTGRVNDILIKNTGTIFYLLKENGEIVRDPFFAPKNIKPLLITTYYESSQKEVPLSSLKKGDSVIVSYYTDTKTKNITVTGIRINR